MAHIDGQTTTDLISNCNAVRSWCEDYVENSITSNASAETNLQRMRDVEFFCGENFLQKRTTYVSAAFELLTDKQNQAFANLSISRRISELQFINAQDKERRSLRESMLLQNQRQQSENDNRRNDNHIIGCYKQSCVPGNISKNMYVVTRLYILIVYIIYTV